MSVRYKEHEFTSFIKSVLFLYPAAARYAALIS